MKIKNLIQTVNLERIAQIAGRAVVAAAAVVSLYAFTSLPNEDLKIINEVRPSEINQEIGYHPRQTDIRKSSSYSSQEHFGANPFNGFKRNKK